MTRSGPHMSRMYYPIFLDLTGRPCVVIGGGSVAERKVRGLLECGARVRVVSPELTEALRGLVEDARIGCVARGYERGDLEGCFLVIAASDDPAVNEGVWEEASGLGILVNVADLPERCNFILPSVLRRGGLALAVGTGGASPALARKLRTDLEARFGPEYAGLVRVMELLREAVVGSVEDPGARRRILKSTAEDAEILNRLKAGESPEAVFRNLSKTFKLESRAAGDDSREERD